MNAQSSTPGRSWTYMMTAPGASHDGNSPARAGNTAVISKHIEIIELALAGTVQFGLQTDGCSCGLR